jgi:type I restriction-modification system DNA methylase subunit
VARPPAAAAKEDDVSAEPEMPAPITADQVFAEDAARRGGEDNVTAYTLSETYESMQSMAARKRGGVWYTPQPVTQWMSSFTLRLGIRQVGPEPDQILRIVAYDPACGCGVFLIEAAQLLARAYAERLVGGEPSPAMVLAVLPAIILRCVFGQDIDPVAVELARRALSLETGGMVTTDMLARHVVAGNSLESPQGPPATDQPEAAQS